MSEEVFARTFISQLLSRHAVEIETNQRREQMLTNGGQRVRLQLCPTQIELFKSKFINILTTNYSKLQTLVLQFLAIAHKPLAVKCSFSSRQFSIFFRPYSK